MKSKILILSLLVLTFLAKAQRPEVTCKFLGQEEGLSNSFVTCIAQDSTGFVWIGTVEGLNSFDGQTFKNYLSDEQKGSIPHNYITDILTDSSGKLWIATLEGLVSYNPQMDNFINYEFEGKVKNEIVQVSKVIEDKGGFIYATSGNQIFRYNESKKLFCLFHTITKGNLTSLLFDNGNKLWIGTSTPAQLISYQVQTSQQKIFDASIKGFPSSDISDIILKDDKIWIGTIGSGIINFDINDHTITSIADNQSQSGSVTNLYLDKKNQIWIIDYIGLKYYDKAQNKISDYNYQRISSDSKTHQVSGIFEDNQGNYWIYHQPGGIYLNMKSKGFSRINNNIDEKWHLSRPNVTAISEDGDGSLWVAHSGPGIDIFNKKTGKIEYIYSAPGNKPMGSVTTLYRDDDNTMWVASYNVGLMHYSKDRSKVEQIVHDPNKSTSLSINDVRSIAPDKKGNLWMTTHGRGVDLFDKKLKTFKNYNEINSQLSNPWTTQLLVDKADNLWVASVWGLNKLEKGSKKFINYYSQPNDTTSLTSNNIVSLYEDTKNNLWVGTEKGLCFYEKEKNHFKRIHPKELNGAICSIQEDQSGDIWISTLRGLFRLSKTNQQLLRFNKEDGLQSEEFTVRSSYINQDGYLYFGGVNGVTLYQPTNIQFNSIPPPVVIHSLKINGVEITPSHPSGILKQQLSYTPEIKIGNQQKIINISYKAINFNNPQRNQYKVILEGFDTSWQYVKNQTSMTYTNLNSGTYTFRVKAANNDGVWNEIGASLIIKIPPPWYDTFLFRIGLITLVIGLIWGAMKLRTHKLIKYQKELTKQVETKTQEIEASNQELMAQTDYLNNLNKLLEDRQTKLETQTRLIATQTQTLRKQNEELQQLNNTKDRLFSIIAHDLINPFNSIIGLSEVFKEEYDHLTEKERKELVSTINVSSNRIYTLLQNLLLWARNQTQTINFNPTSFMLKDILIESTEFLGELLSRKNLSLNIECPTTLFVHADNDMVKTIIRNLVNNAIKYSYRDNQISIVCIRENDRAMISVKDNGMGMDEATINKLKHQKITHTSAGTEGEPGTGIGLHICKEFIDFHKGNFTIKSTPNGGSTFSFSLPLFSTNNTIEISDNGNNKI